jgi:hypothetical protein
MPVTVDHIIDALASLGGEANLSAIVQRVKETSVPPLPADVGASVRARIQERSSGSRSFKGGVDLFESVHGVNARMGRWRLRQVDPLDSANPDVMHDGADAFLSRPEGRAILRIHLRRERSRSLIEKFKATLTKFECAACDFDFGQFYGALGQGYIEAHHTIPIAQLNESSVTAMCDLVPVCANCHRVIHRNNLMSVVELRRFLKRPERK